MPSPTISVDRRQLTLDFDASLIPAHRSLRDCVAAGVYKRGLKIIAADLDLAPGNLSVALSDDTHRKFSVDELERYIQVTGDKSPIYWLVAKYMGDEAAARDQVLAQLSELIGGLPAMLQQAGLAVVPKARR